MNVIIRFKWLAILLSFFTHFSLLSAQNQGCDECLYATIESLETEATIYISWLDQGQLNYDSLSWLAGDTLIVSCSEQITAIQDSSFAITQQGDTLDVVLWTVMEEIVWETIYQVTEDPSLAGTTDTIYTNDCQVNLIFHLYTPPNNDYTCGSIIPSASNNGYRHEMAFPVGSGNNITIDFKAYGIPDTLSIEAGGVVVFKEAIGTNNGGSFPNNVVWNNGVISDFEGSSEVQGSGFVRVILDVVDNCDLKVIAQSNSNPGTRWQLYVHCCPSCYNPPPVITTIDTTLCFEGTIYNNEITRDTSVSQLSFTKAGCDSITVFNVHVAKPIIDSIATIDASCFGFDDGMATAFVSAETPHYSWNNGRVTKENNSLSAGAYLITITDQYGCIASASTIINEPPLLEGIITDIEPRCYGEKNGELTLLPFGGSPFYDILWSNEKTGTSIDSLVSGDYTVTITDSHNCVSIIPFFLDQPDTLITDILVREPTCLGIPDGEMESNTDGGTFPYYYVWSNGSELPDQENLLSGYYVVTVTDENGCIDMSEKTLQSIFEDKTYLPTAFTPNSDWQNDHFLPFSGPCVVKIMKFSIFDRWGNMLFDNDIFQPNNENEGWDGVSRGQKMGTGTYLWYIEILYHSGKIESKKGEIMLLNTQ